MNSENKAMNVEMFRNAGYKIDIKHFRPLFNDMEKKIIPYLPKRMQNQMVQDHAIDLKTIRQENKQSFIFPRGGSTTVRISKGDESYSSFAECSAEDYYRSSFGVSKCLWRITSKMKADGKNI
jgi:hypothetical protein